MAFTKTAGVNYGDPDFTLTTANAAGSNQLAVRNDAEILVFDDVVPTTIAYSDAAAAGSGTTASYRNHTHGMVADPTTAAASVAEMEAATSTTVYASPGRTQNHPGVAKAWVDCSSTGSTNASYNIASTARDSAGVYTITFDTDFDGTAYAAVGSNTDTSNDSLAFSGQAAGSVVLNTFDGGVASSTRTLSAYFGTQ